MKLTPNNWTSFQHYGTRRPPWIKLHRGLLDDRKFNSLPDASRALAPCLWLLASESADGSFDGAPEELAFRLRQKPEWVTKALKPLIDNGFFVLASGVLAEGLQDACLEREREREKEKKYNAPARGACELLPEVDSATLSDWIAVRKAKRAGPITQTVADGLRREAALASLSPQDAVRKAVERGWQGFQADWLTAGQKTPVSSIWEGAA